MSNLQVAKIASCQNCKLPKLQVAKIASCQIASWKWFHYFLLNVSIFDELSWKLPKLKVAKIESCQIWKLPKLKQWQNSYPLWLGPVNKVHFWNLIKFLMFTWFKRISDCFGFSFSLIIAYLGLLTQAVHIFFKPKLNVSPVSSPAYSFKFWVTKRNCDFWKLTRMLKLSFSILLCHEIAQPSYFIS